jgi:hypothetical protein
MQTFGIFGLYIFMVVPFILADTEDYTDDYTEDFGDILGASHNTGQSK